ncbi:MAG: FAD binding domain-containing protein [Peptostreptococcaceae bacterium]
MIKEAYKTSTVYEALHILDTNKNAMIIAGGTDLIVHMRNGRLDKDILVDISDIKELKNIIEEDNIIKIGAGTTFNQIINSEIFNNNLYGLKKAASLVGSPQIRSRGTIGGNICNNSPSADIIPPLLALDAVVVIQSINKIRKIDLRDLLLDKNKVDINNNELITHIEIKRPNDNQSLSFSKLGFRKSLAISKASASVFLDIDNNIFNDIKIALGAISKTVIRLEEVEQYLNGKEATNLNIDNALNKVEEIVRTNLKGRHSVAFKSHVIKGVVENAINEAIVERLRG